MLRVRVKVRVRVRVKVRVRVRMRVTLTASPTRQMLEPPVRFQTQLVILNIIGVTYPPIACGARKYERVSVSQLGVCSRCNSQ